MERELVVERVGKSPIADYHGVYANLYNIIDGFGRTVGTIIERIAGRGDRLSALVWEDGYSKRGLKKVYRESKAAIKE